ncbi:unnamed protein product [Polarella glacialis]|uniref:Uncharacterized protein n=1 Tax=Polarella glacialis TaxID=89957 RepID=A0A813GEM2_POLGL|nr:unnamed protein product [Polarella glacialis]
MTLAEPGPGPELRANPSAMTLAELVDLLRGKLPVFGLSPHWEWADRNIVELIKDVDVANEKGKDFANSLGRKMVRDPSDLVAWYALGGVVLFLVFFKLYETID